MTIQFPKRVETDGQAIERAEEIKKHNEAYGCDLQGRPVDSKGGLLKNLSQKEWDVFKSLRQRF